MLTKRTPFDFLEHAHDLKFLRDVLGGALFGCADDNCDHQEIREVRCEESPTRDHQFEFHVDTGAHEVLCCHYCPRRVLNADDAGLPLYREDDAEVQS